MTSTDADSRATLTEEELAYLGETPTHRTHPCHGVCPHACEDDDCPEYQSEESEAAAASDAREERTREIARHYRDHGVLPDDWRVRIAWMVMDPETYFALLDQQHNRRWAATNNVAPTSSRASWFRRRNKNGTH